MISLKASCYLVELEPNEDDDYAVYVNSSSGIKNVTHSLSENEKESLISDLIYAVSELIKEK